MNLDPQRLSAIIPPLCIWYEANQKPLPWREDNSPYHIWLSEIMLQQTRIEAVIPYYQRFTRELPTIEALASVDDDRLMKLWQGLGYYSRARNLKKAAIQLISEYHGKLPDSADALRKLPGIGDYTAGAIASIAFQKPEPAVDGNVLRVIMRLCACSDDIMLPQTKRDVISALRSVYPSGRNASLLTEGLMELGETVCIPNGEPHCDACPLREMCLGYESGNPSAYPIRNVKRGRRIEERTVLVFTYQDRYALAKRSAKGLLASMWEFPNVIGRLSENEVKTLLGDWQIPHADIMPCGDAKHIFSHVEWHLTGYRIICTAAHHDYVYATAREIMDKYAIPTAFRAFMTQIK